MKRLVPLLLCLLWGVSAHAAVIKTVTAGATDQSVVIKIIDSTDGTPETGVVFNTSGIDLEYWRHGANSVVDITEATQTVSGAHADGGFVSLGNGYYRLDLPDAAVASGATAVEVMGTVTGMIVLGGTVQLSTDTPQTGDAYARLATYRLGELLSGAASSPASDSFFADLLEADGSVFRFNANSLEQAPTAGAADGDLGIVTSGTAVSATSTTIRLASATNFPDNTLNCMTVLITGGTGVGQSRAIGSAAGSWVSSTDTATISPAWTTTPSSDSTYNVFGVSCGTSTPPTVEEIGDELETRSMIVGTNNDKTGYSLVQSFPTNFGSLAITGGGAVTVGTNSDKTGYGLANDAVSSTTLAASAAQEIAAALGAIIGTCDSGSTTTCVDNALTQADASQLEDRLICFDDGWCGMITTFAPGSDQVTTTKVAPTTRSAKVYTIFPATVE